MKKLFAFAVAALLLVTTVLSLTACSSPQNSNPIDFDKKYMVDDESYYIFHSDHTGVFVRHYVYTSTVGSEFDYTLSGSVDFVWREASDGAVHLFEVATHYNEDHTEEKELGLPSYPIYFSEEFFTYTTHSQFGASARYCIKEGSKLEKELAD